MLGRPLMALRDLFCQFPKSLQNHSRYRLPHH